MTHGKLGKKSGFINVLSLIAIIDSLSACDENDVNSQNYEIGYKYELSELSENFDFLSETRGVFNILVIHDNKRGVTCWQGASGISCLPDSALNVNNK